MDQNKIRNFCIIAHIDHGKSTLADRLLQLTGTVSDRDMQEQLLDTMDLEREKGVTIKASAVRMTYDADDGDTYIMNLIDTPGHVDFGYEVSRALQACEGALLVVDAAQGVEAQTLANLYLAIDANLELVPVVNKIDLPAALPDEVAEEIESITGINAADVIPVSAKTGQNVEQILETVLRIVPPPTGDDEAPLQALIFDSHYDSYKGVVAYVRVVEGTLRDRERIAMFATHVDVEPLEIGVFAPQMKPVKQLQAGEVGYVATGLKSVRECRVGDTITSHTRPAAAPLPGYQAAKPMVFAGFFPTENEDYQDLKDALEKLQLNDAALVYEPETSNALNFGFRCGFLGLFHMEIIQERLEREYDLDILATAPSVRYEVLLNSGDIKVIQSPADLPSEDEYVEIAEPWMHVQIFSPEEYYGVIMELATKRRGEFVGQEYPASGRIVFKYDIPLAELIVDFYDKLKSGTRGYASMDYEFAGYRTSDLVKLDVLVNKQPVDALTMIVHRDMSYERGTKLVTELKKRIPRQLFEVPIQAAVGKRVISRANVKALRKDVLAKCYGGDITRKKKLLEKQKKGKKRMKMIGSVEVPQEAFMAVLRLHDD
ncbi:MAG: translation elongation factor 4 [Anaerolineae bacterium]|nr:translation elongation factor 4 [Anaerolineae bacterium]MCO5188437.1 translation elongation factor 4 [Anaerolineae bacterium]MCO5192942.1 translation elongation factor 4 [Anaerolineae bacterium]MCO5198466.1 translation elongation factor 4 [Anaerolineae bacterium]MCO5205918.1 translation elongation factor 4 [Anaerolineae bacterium]